MDFLADVESCIPSLRRYARALLHHAADADDLVQDCLERAIGRRHLWLGGETVRPWLFRIMRNIHANRARRLHGGPAFEPIFRELGVADEFRPALAPDDPRDIISHRAAFHICTAPEGVSYYYGGI